MKYQIRLFFTALMFYTRIPCPRWTDHSEAYLNRSSRYFSLVGWLVGLIGFLVFYFFAEALSLPSHVAAILSIGATIFATGGFHEDGFADTCDGFGGGWTTQKILEIMKDSRVGTFGVLGLVLILLLKIALIAQLPLIFRDWVQIGAVYIASHSLSRAVAASFLYTHPYAREDAASKAKPLATQMLTGELIFLLLIGILPLFFIGKIEWALISLAPLYLLKVYLGWYFTKWIGGYTGDCLGATQQAAEVLFLLCIITLWNYTSSDILQWL